MLDNLFLKEHLKEIIATIIIIATFIIIRVVVDSIILKFSRKIQYPSARTKLVMKYINVLMSCMAIIMLIGVWGVESKQAFVVISSVFTVIGVAMFAQWSILSNITAGIILFFSFPFKIGDKIKILDKELPLEAEIIDIKSFYTFLKTFEGEYVSYPNNLLLQKGIAIIPEKKKNDDTKDYID